MDTLDFLKAVLPEEGVYYLALFKPGHRFPGHKHYLDLETMAAEAVQFSQDDRFSGVYHACSSYLRPYIELDELNEWGKPKRKYRVAENWSRARAFWVDIDCGEAKAAEGKGYAKKAQALAAVDAFSAAIGWPKPMVVDSGGGLHVYWPLVKSIRADAWVKVATWLKAALAHVGVLADPTRTADFASILRPAGTVNGKYDPAKPVNIKRECEPQDPAVLADALLSWVRENEVKPPKQTPQRDSRSAPGINSEFTRLLPPKLPTSGALIATKCLQVQAMRDSRGDVTYEVWRSVIGLLTFCDDGRELAEEWSQDRESTGHGQVDWQAKFDTWNAGPSTCEFIEQHNPNGCVGCPFKGKVKSPIVLGREAPEAAAPVVAVVPADGDANAVVAVQAPALPAGYVWENDVLWKLVPDKDGVLHSEAICRNLWYPVARIRAEDGTFRIVINMHLHDGRVREFEILASAVASPSELLKALAAYELYSEPESKNAGTHMMSYLKAQMEQLKAKAAEMNTCNSFGWRPDGTFLVGDRLYHTDGSVRTAYLGQGTSAFKHAFPAPRGNWQGYAQAINTMYNRPGAEHWQYALCSGWGSILTPMTEELYNGLLLALTGGDSGKGKTTVCFASMYAFGDATKMTCKSKEGFTTNGLWKQLGTFGNMPLLLDELTNMDPKAFSDVAYGVSNGQEKVRLAGQKNGEHTFAHQATWRLSPFVTGNRDFHGLLAQNQANSQAEAVRLIQIHVDRYAVVKLHEDPDQEALLVQQCVDAMKDNAGAAGDRIVRYVVTHQEQVANAVRQLMGKLNQELSAPKYRFYRAHAACTLTMAKIAKGLGIIDFDMPALYRWTVALLKELAESVAETNTITIEDAFFRMVNHLTPRIIVTNEFRDARYKGGPEAPRNRVHGEVAGRFILGTPQSTDRAGELILHKREVRDWCMGNRVDYNALIKHLKDIKVWVVPPGDGRMNLTKGTDLPAMQVHAIIVNTYRLPQSHLSLVNDAAPVDAVAV